MDYETWQMQRDGVLITTAEIMEELRVLAEMENKAATGMFSWEVDEL